MPLYGNFGDETRGLSPPRPDAGWNIGKGFNDFAQGVGAWYGKTFGGVGAAPPQTAEPMPYQQNLDSNMSLLGNLINETANRAPNAQDMGAARDGARQAGAVRGLTGGLGARLETGAQQGVINDAARRRTSDLMGLLGLSNQTALGASGQETQRRAIMMQLAQQAAQGDQNALQQLMGLVLGIGGGIAGGVVGGPAGAMAGYSLGNGVGNGIGSLMPSGGSNAVAPGTRWYGGTRDY
jgi:hypothetical protein